ncbi:trigger factor [Roseivirga sp.]|uniref:trigger factor n=1 Tax=Roseivirga sp. TaxID=1964215 RepID=UPI003B51BDB1
MNKNSRALDITLDKKDSNIASIKVKLNEADYQSKVDEKIKDYSKKAQIKGFRPGKVPQGLVKKMYGKSILVDEINHMVGHAIQDYIRDNELKILGEPIPNQQQIEAIDWDTQSDFEFEYNVGLVEDFTVDLGKKVKVTQYEIEVNDQVIDETVENVRTQFGKMTNPEVSEEGDMLFGTLSQESSDITHDTTIDPSEFTKTNAKKFVGKKQGDVIAVDLAKLYKEKSQQAAQLGKTEDELEGIDLKFNFEVKNVNRRELAEIDQELFDKTFGPDTVKTEEEFRAKVSDTISENYERETNAWLNKTIQDELIKNTTINLPDAFLKDWLKLTGEGKITDADLENEYDQYADQLRWNLISGQISKDSEVKAEHEDIKEATRKMIEAQFMGSGLGQMADQMDSFVEHYLQGENGQNYMKMAEQVQQEKVLEHIKSQIDIKSKKVSLDKFKEIVNA